MEPQDMRSEDNDISSYNVSSHTISSSSEPQSQHPASFTAEPSSSSSSRQLTPPWAEVPVSFVPSTWPTGPRELPQGRYVCPDKYCSAPIGLMAPGQGYSRTTLIRHMWSHGGLLGIHRLMGTVRKRANKLRQTLRRTEGDEDDEFHYSSEEPDEDDFLQREESDFFRDLEDIKAWELSCRHMHHSGSAEKAHGVRESSRAPSHPSAVSEWLGAVSPPKKMYIGRETPPGVDYRALFSDQDLNPQLEGEVLKASQRARERNSPTSNTGSGLHGSDSTQLGADEQSPRHQSSKRPQDDRSRLSAAFFNGDISVHPSLGHGNQEIGMFQTSKSNCEPPTKKARTSGSQQDDFDGDAGMEGDEDAGRNDWNESEFNHDNFTF